MLHLIDRRVLGVLLAYLIGLALEVFHLFDDGVHVYGVAPPGQLGF